MFKMGSHIPFEYFKHKLGPKERSGVKLPTIKSRKSNYKPLKVGNHHDLLAFKWHATYHWKVLDKGYNFTLKLTLLVEGLHKKLWTSKVIGIPISGIRDSQF
jgi:hypothetical protein